MVKFVEGTDPGSTELVVNDALGQFIWDEVKSAIRVRFDREVAVEATVVQRGKDKRLVKLTEEPPDDGRWDNPFSMANPSGMRMETSIETSATVGGELKDDVEGVVISTVPSTNSGAFFRCEFKHYPPNTANGMIRIPVKDQMVDEVREVFEDEMGYEIIRVGAEAFKTKFSDTFEGSNPSTYSEPHIKMRDITSTKEAAEAFETALDFAERAER